MVEQKHLQSFCDMKGYSDITVYEDGAVSGGKPMLEKPAGSSLMEDAKNGKLDLILITKLDRGFRNVVVAIQTIEALGKFKVKAVE